MSSLVVDLRTQRDRALAKADEIVTGAERQKRSLTHIENQIVDKCTTQAQDLNGEIARIENVKSLRSKFPAPSLSTPSRPGEYREEMLPKKLSADYAAAFSEYIARDGKMSAALTEGTNTAGGFAVPAEVAGEIVPLAPADYAVRQLAKVISTTADLKVPQKSSQTSAAIRAESGNFSTVTPALTQFTLFAFNLASEEQTSFEIAQDVAALQAFCIDDLSIAIQELEETKFISGSGSGEPQGMLGNIDTGVAAATADSAGNLLSIDATLTILGTLKGRYHTGASFLMARATGIALRKAQVQSANGYFEPVFTRVGAQDYLHGYPVAYSEQMPAIAAGNTPVIFGDFEQGYVIGDRGGPAIRVKTLDQAYAVNGLIGILGWRRTDGRVRRPEALKALTLHT